MRSFVGRRVPVLLGTVMLLVVAVAPREIASWAAPAAARSGAAMLLPSLAGDAVLGAKPEPRRWARAHRIDHAWPLVAAVAPAAVAVLRWRLPGLAVGRACLARSCCAGAVRAPPRGGLA
jgi:hypothetical protein